jgi:hypothetical protein
MKLFLFGVLFLALSLGMIPSSNAAEPAPCGLKKVDLKPLSPNDFSKYVGKGAQVQLTFTNDEPSKPATQFNEYPLEVKNLKTKTACKIDGGIWLAKQVYIGDGEKIIVLEEDSGSNADLAFYDSATCKGVGKLDITGPKVSITESRVVSEGACEPYEKGEERSPAAASRWRCISWATTAARSFKTRNHGSSPRKLSAWSLTK